MAIPDKFHRMLQKLIEKEKPESMEDLEKLMNSLTGRPLPDIPEEDLTPEDRALDLMDEAWQASAAKGKKMAEEALKTWPDCIPAYEFLAARTKSGKRRMEYLEQAVGIGQRLFGGEFLTENRGHFWGITETRPYMRCLDALAHGNSLMGNFSKAIVIWEDMLDLNPHDNQGIRYRLLPTLLAQQDLTGYHKYRAQFEEEESTMMLFNDALADFIADGRSKNSDLALSTAISHNPYVLPLLLADAPPPPEKMPASYMLQSPEEAMIYAFEAHRLWHMTPGAIGWAGQLSLKKNKPGVQKLTPTLDKLPYDQLRILANDPFNPLSPLQLRDDLKTEDLPELPFLQMTVKLLELVQARQPLKLTAKGNLPRKVVRELYDLRIYPDKYVDEATIKLQGEEDFFPLHMAHVVAKAAKLISKRSGKASLTKKGAAALASPATLYLEMLRTFIEKFNWAYPERWGYGVEQTGQMGWACIMYEIMRQGEKEKSDKFYVNEYLKIYPDLLEAYPISEYGTPEDKVASDFKRRFFHWFALRFGLVEITKEVRGEHDLVQEIYLKRTNLADRVFEVVSLF